MSAASARLDFSRGQPPPAAKDLALEGLRGFAALVVLYAHLTPPVVRLDPNYAPSPQWWRFEFGGGAVLLFFVLSGYVIGLTNQRVATPSAIRSFWWRRFWRLFPINVIAVGLAWIALPSTAPRALWANLFFLQDSHPVFGVSLPLLAANTNLWSLHYEMVYYLVFPLVWTFRPRTAVLVTGLVAVAALRVGFPPAAFLANLAAGGCFWIAGLWLAWCGQTADASHRGPGWPTALLLFFVACRLQVAINFALRTGISFPWAPEVNFWNLDELPAALLLVAAVAGRLPPYPRVCLALAVGLPGIRLAWQMIGHGGLPLPDSQMYALIWMLALALLAWRPARQAWGALAAVGTVSYALYALAAPVQVWVLHQTWLPTGSPGPYLLRAAVVVVVAGVLAWAAEAKLQPLIVARVRRRPPAA